MKSKGIKFKTVDVFTDQVFFGNPLAVFFDCIDLKVEEMQSIAKEVGYSETAFVFAPKQNSNTAKVRIFTPAGELPFAGHPNIGVSYLLFKYPKYILGSLVDETMILEQLAGNVQAIANRDENKQIVGTEIRAPENFQALGPIPFEPMSSAIGLEVSQICLGKYSPSIASVGLPFGIVKVKSLEILESCVPNISEFQFFDKEFRFSPDGFSVLVYTEENNQKNDSINYIRARVFCPLMGIVEDPATGSACGALAGFLLSIASPDKLDISISVNQGIEIGRESKIWAKAVRNSNESITVSIGGHCIEVFSGILEI